MKAQWENKVMSSVLLFLDHEICSKGQAFTNVSGAVFYPVEGKYGTWPYNSQTDVEMHTYALPYKQIIIDVGQIAPKNCFSIVYYFFQNRAGLFWQLFIKKGVNKKAL